MRASRLCRIPLAVLISVLMLVSGCGGGHTVGDGRVVSHDDVRLTDDMVMAFYQVYVSGTADDAPEGSLLVLVSEDGSFEAVHLGTMTGGTPIWTDAGLHFADKDNDYVLTEDGLASFPNAKPWDQLVGLADGDVGGGEIGHHRGPGQRGGAIAE